MTSLSNTTIFSQNHKRDVKAKPSVCGLMQTSKRNATKSKEFISAVDNLEEDFLWSGKEDDYLPSFDSIKRKHKKSVKDQLALQKAI